MEFVNANDDTRMWSRFRRLSLETVSSRSLLTSRPNFVSDKSLTCRSRLGLGSKDLVHMLVHP